MIDEALDSFRSAPLMEDFSKMEIKVAQRRAQQRMTSNFANAGIPETVMEAARNNKTADKDYVAACQKLLRDRWSGRITYAQFLEGCDALDKLADTLNPRGTVRFAEPKRASYVPYKED